MTPPNEVDALKVKLTVRDLIVVVAVTVSISGGMYASTAGLRSDVRDILTRMQDQTKLDEANAKVAEERAANLRESVEAMKRRQELQQYEIQGLKEMILKQGASK